MMNYQDIVRVGYDKVSYQYRGNDQDSDCIKYHAWLDMLIPLLHPGQAVLDLGCGCGIPVADRLAARYPFTGVDISPVQIQRARDRFPDSTFICADMELIELPQNSYQAIVSFYALIHIPIDEQRQIIKKIKSWLQPEGYLMLTIGHKAWTGTENDWLGVQGATMYWSHADSATYESWLTQTGFTIVSTRFIPEGDGGHTLILSKLI